MMLSFSKILRIVSQEFFEIYEEKKKLTANYPVRVEFIKNNKKERILAFTYKLDYTKPEQTTYIQCKKVKKI